MPFFKELDPEIAKKMVEGHEDVLTERVRTEFDFISRQTCPRCGSNVIPEAHLPRLLKGGIPRPLARCPECRCLFDPYSGILLEMGNLGRLEPAIRIIYPSDD